MIVKRIMSMQLRETSRIDDEDDISATRGGAAA